MWLKVGLGYFLFQVVVLIIFLVWSSLKDKRTQTNHGTTVPEGYETTGEIQIDPVSHVKHEIYFNKENGKRFYKTFEE